MGVEELGGVRPILVYRLSQPVTLFRAVLTDEQDDPHFLVSFKSNYERGRKPRKQEIDFTPVHMGLSMYTTQRKCANVARALQGRIGDHVAQVPLVPEIGVAFALTSEPGHLTVWGRALQLAQTVADIVYIEEIE